MALLWLTGCGPATPTSPPTTLTVGPEPTSTATASVPAAATPDSESVWQVVDGFPPSGGSISAISTLGSHGFVIAGSVEAADPACAKQREARLWVSQGGLAWQETPLDDASNATANLLPIGANGSLAIGGSGSPGCPGDGVVAWSLAAGSTWSRLPTTGLDPDDQVVDITALHDSADFVATGRFADGGDVMGVWTVGVDSTGTDWQHATNPPPSIGRATLASLAAAGDTLIGFDSPRSLPAWYSLDGGQSWTNAGFRPSYKFITTDAGTRVNGFLATGRACCGLPGQLVGAVVGSVDGQNWTDVRGGLAFAAPIEAVASTRVGWVALGEETYLSADEDDWRLGPALPSFELQAHLVNGVAVPYRLAAAASDSEMVVISPDRVWIAALDDLTPDRWPTPAPEAEMPVVGGQYEHTLLTHCGPLNGPLYFGLRSWVPDLPEGYFPTSFDSYYERGTLSFVAEDRLEFIGRNGEVVVYRPTDDPPASFPCA